MPKTPAMRVADDGRGIEVDIKKGKWPFIRMIRQPDNSVLILMDTNEGGSVAGRSENMAGAVISPKKAAFIRSFLEATE